MHLLGRNVLGIRDQLPAGRAAIQADLLHAERDPADHGRRGQPHQARPRRDGVIYGFYQSPGLASVPVTGAGKTAEWTTQVAVPKDVAGLPRLR